MLGHERPGPGQLLPRFVAHLDHIGAEVITVEAALAWAQQPQARPAAGARPADDRGPRIRPPQPASIRGLRCAAGPALPPAVATPFIYSDADIGALMAQCQCRPLACGWSPTRR